jgi:hypothetical protein
MYGVRAGEDRICLGACPVLWRRFQFARLRDPTCESACSRPRVLLPLRGAVS